MIVDVLSLGYLPSYQGSQQQNTTVFNSEQSEANLDIQYTVGLATGVPVVFVSVGDDNQASHLLVAVGDAYLDIVNYLAGEDSPPTVWTTSYGLVESMLSPAFADRICNAYAALGARGTSVLFASGDGGISGLQNETCSTFVPTFPSGCPYVTSVGATQNVDPEVAASFSSGGFSTYFAAPSYQTNATTKYLSAIGPVANAGLYNASGRGYPDVALIGNHVEIISNGTMKPVLGTNCSSPIFASIIALLNDELIVAGKPPLGFLNPWLYSTAVLNDITTGSNPGCNTNGFYTMSGWDPVTGLGSPDYVNLRAAAGLP
ncbi:subtilisin-like protein [Peniophora sp. CONT]|nr:subtilisin-like protein [Peniophora sp. CONT]